MAFNRCPKSAEQCQNLQDENQKQHCMEMLAQCQAHHPQGNSYGSYQQEQPNATEQNIDCSNCPSNGGTITECVALGLDQEQCQQYYEWCQANCNSNSNA